MIQELIFLVCPDKEAIYIDGKLAGTGYPDFGGGSDVLFILHEYGGIIGEYFELRLKEVDLQKYGEDIPESFSDLSFQKVDNVYI